MELLRAGEGFFSRAVLLLVERFGLTGVGQFGVRAGDASVDESIRNLWLPLGAPSLVGEAIAAGRTCRGQLEPTDANQAARQRARRRVAGRGGGAPRQGRPAPRGRPLRRQHADRGAAAGARSPRGEAGRDRRGDRRRRARARRLRLAGPAGGRRRARAPQLLLPLRGLLLAPRVKRRSGLARPRPLRPEAPPAATRPCASPPGSSLFPSLARDARSGPASPGGVARAGAPRPPEQ